MNRLALAKTKWLIAACYILGKYPKCQYLTISPNFALQNVTYLSKIYRIFNYAIIANLSNIDKKTFNQ